MKFVLRRNDDAVDFWLITYDQFNATKNSGITFPTFDKLTGSEKLTFDEIASFILLQRLMAKLLGKLEYSDDFIVANEINNTKLTTALNNESITKYFIELLSGHNTYFYKRYHEGILLMIAEKGMTEKDLISWTLLEGDKLSLAIADTLYKVYGNQDLHFNPIVTAAPDQFTLANVFYALEQGH